MQGYNDDDLVEFLVAAKRETYASSDQRNRVLSDLNGTVRYEYRKGDFLYVDLYSGTRKFSGMEIVYHNNGIIWSMVYYGGITVPEAEAQQTYAFLKSALVELDREKPFRGPENARFGDYLYTNRCEGDFRRFSGTELILWKEQEIYDLKYQGGMII